MNNIEESYYKNRKSTRLKFVKESEYWAPDSVTGQGVLYRLWLDNTLP